MSTNQPENKYDLFTYSFTEEDVNLITFSLRRMNETTGIGNIKTETADLLAFIKRQQEEKKAEKIAAKF